MQLADVGVQRPFTGAIYAAREAERKQTGKRSSSGKAIGSSTSVRTRSEL